MKTSFSAVVVLSCLLAYRVYCLVSDDPVLPITLNVAVWTAGLPQISPKDLTLNLKSILPRYFPASEGGKPVHDVQLLLNYEAHSAPDNFVHAYEKFIVEHPMSSDGFHVIFIDELSTFIRNEVDSAAFKASFPTFNTFTLPVLIVNSGNIQKHMIIATAEESEQCTMSVLSSVAFLDLTARVCDVTQAISHDAKQIRWSTPVVSHPFPFTYPVSKRAIYEPSVEAHASHLTSRVAGLVTSAIQAMSTGNLRWRPAHATEKIYCPIVMLRGGPVSGGHDFQPNIPALESWLSSILLPHQQVVLITTVHYIDEHPQLSVAIATAHMTYAATVLGNSETSTTHVEKIPYIDSNLLFHEMTSVGDRLCDLLLHQTGHGEALRSLQQDEELKANMGPKVKAGKSDNTSKDKAWRSAAVVPVFVMEDLHIHHDRHLTPSLTRDKSKNQEHYPSARADIPVQPLFNKDSAVAVDSDSSSVLVLHSTKKRVSTFSPHTKSWKESDLSDLDSLIAEGLTKALTGFSAPHTQLESSDVVDLTWTHGTHPFAPYGHLPYEPDMYHSLFATSIQRGIAIARAHRVMQRAISISHRATAIEAEMSDGFRYLHSLHGSSRQAGRSFAAVNSKAQTGGHKIGDRLLDTDTVLPDMMMTYSKNVREKAHKLVGKLHFLREAFKVGDLDRIVEIFQMLEGEIETTEAFVEDVETTMHLQLKNCHVALDVDPHLVEQIGNRKLSQSAYDRMSMSPHARRKDHNSFDAGQFNTLYIAATTIAIISIGLGIYNVHLRMTKQLKKRM